MAHHQADLALVCTAAVMCALVVRVNAITMSSLVAFAYIRTRWVLDILGSIPHAEITDGVGLTLSLFCPGRFRDKGDLVTLPVGPAPSAWWASLVVAGSISSALTCWHLSQRIPVDEVARSRRACHDEKTWLFDSFVPPLVFVKA